MFDYFNNKLNWIIFAFKELAGSMFLNAISFACVSAIWEYEIPNFILSDKYIEHVGQQSWYYAI